MVSAHITSDHQRQSLETFSDTNEVGIHHDFVYPDMVLNLPPGMWLIEAEATVFADVSDAVSLRLHNATEGANILASRSAIDITPSEGWPVPLHTSKVLTVLVLTTVQIKGFRNGGSTVGFGATANEMPRRGQGLGDRRRDDELRISGHGVDATRRISGAAL